MILNCVRRVLFSLFHFRRRNQNSNVLCHSNFSVLKQVHPPDVLPHIFSYSRDKLASLRLRILPRAADPSEQHFYTDIFPCIHPRGSSIIPTTSSPFIVIDIFISSLVAIIVPTIAHGKRVLHVHVCVQIFFSRLRGTNLHRVTRKDFCRK